MQDLELEYEFSLRPDERTGFGSYVTRFHGRALLWDDEAADDREVGHIKGQRVDLAAARYDRADIPDLLDSISPELSEFAGAVLAGDGHCPTALKVVSHGPGGECDCLVYIAAIEVEPDLRGQHIGTGLLRRFAEVVEIDHCLIGLKAFPPLDDPAARRTPAQIQQVKHFYERLGFVHGAGEFMIKDAAQCDPAKKRRRGHRGDVAALE